MISSKLWQITLFYKRGDDDITLLIVYVDDMIVTGNNSSEIEKLQNYLSRSLK